MRFASGFMFEAERPARSNHSPAYAAPVVEVVLVRHGETEWSRDRKHTSRTDIALTAEGRRQAEVLGDALRGRRFAAVWTSSRVRATETCRLAGFGEVAVVRDELREWDYGAYEGRTTVEIRDERPGWTLWRDGVPGGETAEEVGARADRFVGELRQLDGDAAVFSHGHFLRVLTARWLGLDPGDGRLFALDTGTIGVLGYEREIAVLRLWNQTPR
jgi:broad specificity phosphatase PhoE